MSATAEAFLLRLFLSPGGLVLFNDNPLRAFGRRRNVNIRRQTCLGGIRRGHVAPEIAYRRGLHQVDTTAAKSSAGHSRANQAALRPGNFYHKIEFPAADFVIIPQTPMRVL